MALLKSPRGHHQTEKHYSRATGSLTRARSGHFRIDYAALHPRKRGPLPARNVRDGGQTRSSGGFRLTSAQVPQAEFQAAQCDVAAVPGTDSCTTAKRNLYWITSSARSWNSRLIVSPSVCAVLRLTTSSNLLGCSIGRSAGFAPFRILST